jgi:hypothetical protein
MIPFWQREEDVLYTFQGNITMVQLLLCDHERLKMILWDGFLLYPQLTLFE